MPVNTCFVFWSSNGNPFYQIKDQYFFSIKIKRYCIIFFCPFYSCVIQSEFIYDSGIHRFVYRLMALLLVVLIQHSFAVHPKIYLRDLDSLSLYCTFCLFFWGDNMLNKYFCAECLFGVFVWKYFQKYVGAIPIIITLSPIQLRFTYGYLQPSFTVFNFYPSPGTNQ